jgi:hypothetical protein
MADLLQLKLEDFLPSYADFEDGYDDDIFNIYNNDAPENVFYRKKEFYSNKLDLIEEKPTEKGIPLKTQYNISRFLSPQTLNSEILIFHGLGSGKTCSAVNISELARSMNPNLRPTLVLVKGGALRRNFIRELSMKCTDGRYIPENYNSLSAEKKVIRMNKLVSKSYEIRTFETFAKNVIGKMTDKYLKQEYSNRVIIIDEVHNIRIQPKKKKDTVDVYGNFHRFLHLIENRKICLLSATPVRDKPEEFASVMNLILPLGVSQLPAGKEFTEKFFEGNNIIERDVLKKAIRGRVSYVRSMESGILRYFKGEVIKDMKKIKIVSDKMSEFQTKYYNKAYNIDIGKRGNNIEDVGADDEEEKDKKSQGLYDKSRQASLFVFPDGSYGSEGFNKYVTVNKNNYSLIPSFINLLTKNGSETTPRQIIEKIKKYSSIYAETLTEIINYPDENTFVYNKYVQGSGAILFSELLKLVGFERTRGRITMESKGKKNIKKDNLVELKDEESDEDESDEDESDEDESDDDSILKLDDESDDDSNKYDIDENEGKMDDKDDDDQRKREQENKRRENKERKEKNKKNDDPHPASINPVKKRKGKEKEEEKEMIDQVGVVKRVSRYAIITGETVSEVEVDRIIDGIFNSEENKNGKYIQVIIGSQIIGEGKSLRNVRQIHIQTPHWNNSETEQAIGRGIRAFSLDDLKPNDRFVKVFRRAAIPFDNNIESINYMMYKISENKDFQMKHIERLCKESAVDCGLNKKRNQLETDIDMSRECDYMKCDYKCDFREGEIPTDELIFDTYNLFYAENEIYGITGIVKQLFRKNFSYTLNDFINKFTDISPMIIIRSLKKIIDESLELVNKYGFTCFLREDKNLYFLVDQITLPGSFLLARYTQHPNIKSYPTFDDMVQIAQYKYIGDKLCIIKNFDVDDPQERSAIITQIDSMPSNLKSMFLEIAIVGERDKKNKKMTNLRKLVIEHFRNYITDIDGMTVSSLMYYEEEESVRCLDKKSIDYKEWHDCDVDVESKLQISSEEERIRMENNPYGYYGELVPDKGTNSVDGFIFKIKKIDVKLKAGEKVDKRKQSRGAVCGSIGKISSIVNIINRINRDELTLVPLNIEMEDIGNNRKKFITFIQSRSSPHLTKKYLNTLSDIRIVHLNYWYSRSSTIVEICKTIKKWFIDNNLMRYRTPNEKKDDK